MNQPAPQHPEIPAGETTVAWRSAGQLAGAAGFREWLEHEFPHGPPGPAAAGDDALGRRSFLKLMGASSALAGFGVAACRRPEQYIVPFSQAPEWVIPGKPVFYATAMPRPAGATPLVATTFEGRPTLVAPNRLHPDCAGTDHFAQAAVLDLYSPDRSRTVLKAGRPATRAAFEAALPGLADPGRRPAFLFGRDQSPTRDRLRRELARKFPGAKFYAYEPLEPAGRHATLADLAGAGTEAVADFAMADRILSLDCDFALLDPQGPVTPFFRRRKPEGAGYAATPDPAAMNRLYVVESSYSLTGGMADHRLRTAPSQVLKVAAALVRQVAALTGREIGALASDVPLTGDDRADAWVRACAADLAAHAGRALVLAGSRQPEAVHRLALALNAALDSLGEGKPLRLLVATGRDVPGSLAELHADVASGAVDTLFLLTPANPVYDAPADLKFGELLESEGLVSVHLGLRADATAHAANWHLPAAHFLEAWADTCSATGILSIIQPMILPLHDACVSEVELLLALLDPDARLATGEGAAGAPAPALAAVRATFADVGGPGEEPWQQALRDGFLTGHAWQPVGTPLPEPKDRAPVAGATAGPAPAAGSYEVVFATDASVWDGRWIDNGWLQEAPDPVTKLTWDNAALVSPATAKELGVYDHILRLEPVTRILGTEVKNAPRPPDGEASQHRGPMIRVAVNDAELELPVLVAFGHADGVITIPLGYGQGFDADDELGRGPHHDAHVGQVGANRGFNAYPLRTTRTTYFAAGATATPTGRSFPLALTQEHHAMYGRALAREVSTLDAGDGKGAFLQQLAGVARQGIDAHAPPNISLYKPVDADGRPFLHDELHQWAMSIDLSACMGCNACLVACQAENNIPIVGKRQVAIGREMHWIRTDRYFAAQPGGDPGNPALVPQPVACVQCESAPCETVCPVNATVHTEDGLNAMAYNRCIGTRYCANNCPYKARRFNYFDYNKRDPLPRNNLYQGPAGSTTTGEPPHLQRNPNVTVRMRGIMEKCTYCIQRLKDARIRQKRAHRQAARANDQPSHEVPATPADLRIPPDSVRTACQDACPAEAITFGNLRDDTAAGAPTDARVVAARRLDRSYLLLNYLNTTPRTSYLARVKNPNPDMPDANHVGKATIHMV